jgi:hypothetical protein
MGSPARREVSGDQGAILELAIGVALLVGIIKLLAWAARR